MDNLKTKNIQSKSPVNKVPTSNMTKYLKNYNLFKKSNINDSSIIRISQNKSVLNGT